MARVTIPWMGWVLVCDGARALIFRNRGDGELLDLETIDAMAEPHPRARELGADRPGRVHESQGEGRSAVAEIDRHEAAEVEFLARVAARLDERLTAAERKTLVVVAPPRVLGVLRQCLTPVAKEALTAEIGKDLVHLSTGDIEKRLAAARTGD